MQDRSAWLVLFLTVLPIGCQSDIPRLDPVTRQRVERNLSRANAEIQRDDKNAAAYSDRSVAKWRLGDYQEALQDASRAVALDPTDARAYVNRSAARLALDDRNGAIDDALEAMVLDPTNQGAWNNLLAAEGPLQVEELNRGYGGWVQFQERLEKMAKDDEESLRKELDDQIDRNPKRFRLYTRRSLVKRDAGDLNGALSDINRAIELNPASGRLYLVRGLVKLKLRDARGAFADFDRAVEYQPYMIDGYLTRGRIRLALGNFEGGLADFTKVIELTPKSAIGYQARGIVRMGLGDRRGALVDYSKAIEVAALGPSGSFSKQPGLIGSSKREFRAVESWQAGISALFYRGLLRQAVGDDLGAIADLDHLLGLNPQPMPETFVSMAHAARGSAEAQIGRIEASLADYANAVQLAPDLGLAHSLRGDLYARLGRMSEAMQEYDRASRVEPTWMMTYLGRANLKQLIGDYGGALEDYSLVIERGTASPSIDQTLDAETAERRAFLREWLETSRLRPWALLGRSLLKRDLGEFASALADLEEATRGKPQSLHDRTFQVIARDSWCELDDVIAEFAPAELLAQGGPWYHRIKAHSHRARGDWGQAVSEYTMAIKGNPADALTYFHRSAAKSRLGDRSGALSDLDHAITLNPSRPDFLARRSVAKAAAGDLSGSIDDAKRTLQLNGRLPISWAHRAEAKRRLGNYRGALDDASVSLQLDPTLVQAFITRGAALLALGNKNEARGDLERARALRAEESLRVETLLMRGPEPCLTDLPGHSNRSKDTGACACATLRPGTTLALAKVPARFWR